MKFSFRKGEGDYSVTLTQSKKMYFSKDGKNTITNTPQNALINYRLEVKNDRAEKYLYLKEPIFQIMFKAVIAFIRTLKMKGYSIRSSINFMSIYPI